MSSWYHTDTTELTMDEKQSLIAKVQINLKTMPKNKEPAILIATGTFSPVHRMHIKNFVMAKQFMDENTKYYVVGGFISPTHYDYCQIKLRDEAVESNHRINLLNLGINESKGKNFISVDPWHTQQS